MHYRVVAAVMFIVAVVGAKAALGMGSSDTAAAVATPLATLPASTPDSTSPWDISGTIQQMNGEFWEIQGFAIRVTSTTEVTGDVPSNGVFVRAQGTVDSDGIWQAGRVWVGSATTPVATNPTDTTLPAAAMASATATPTPSASATVSPTASATPKADATSTRGHSRPATSPPTATATNVARKVAPPAPAPSRPTPLPPHAHPGHGKKG